MRRKKETRDFFKPIYNRSQRNKTKRNNNEKEEVENIVEQEYIQKLLIWIFANGHEREDKEKTEIFLLSSNYPSILANSNSWSSPLGYFKFYLLYSGMFVGLRRTKMRMRREFPIF